MTTQEGITIGDLLAENERLQESKRHFAALADAKGKENVALRAALKPFAQIGWMTSDTEHTGRTVVAHMHPESDHEIILSSDDFRAAARALDQS